MKYIKRINNAGIELFVVGIGNDSSRQRFCNYTKLPQKYLLTVENSDFHNRLLIERGIEITSKPLINLTLMCMGIGSPGTLSEVLRGYLGDKKASNFFVKGEIISVSNLFNFNSSLFNYFGNKNSLQLHNSLLNYFLMH